MKFSKTVIALVAATILAGCSTLESIGSKPASKPQEPGASDSRTQNPRTSDSRPQDTRTSDSRLSEPKTPEDRKKLTTSFARQGIKLEWDCVHQGGVVWKTCDKYEVISIEATAYTASFGITEPQRERAFKVAEAKAKAKLAHFVREEIKSTSTVNTLARNIEKAKSSSKTNAQSEFSINMSDDENKDKNYDTSETTTETAQTVAESVSVSSELIMRGVRVIDEKSVDRRTVSVTVRWDLMGDDGAASLQNKFTATK